MLAPPSEKIRNRGSQQQRLKIQKFLIAEAGYTSAEVNHMNQEDMLKSFVHGYCNIQMHSLNRRGMMVEVLGRTTNINRATTQESLNDKWARMAGLT